MRRPASRLGFGELLDRTTGEIDETALTLKPGRERLMPP